MCTQCEQYNILHEVNMFKRLDLYYFYVTHTFIYIIDKDIH